MKSHTIFSFWNSDEFSKMEKKWNWTSFCLVKNIWEDKEFKNDISLVIKKRDVTFLILIFLFLDNLLYIPKSFYLN